MQFAVISAQQKARTCPGNAKPKKFAQYSNYF